MNDKRYVELEKLKEFARYVIRLECWDWWDEQDGGDLQALALRLGLIESHIVTKEEIAEPGMDDYDAGDMVYRYSDILK